MPYYFNKNEFKPYNFIDKIKEYFKKNPCPLCNSIHPVKFYCFVKRKSFNNISVVRIICLRNNNVPSIEKEQYTLTILPAFIQPYARKKTQDIIDTCHRYIDGTYKNQIQAAVNLGAENIRSFTRYINRVKARISDWIVLLSSKISHISGKNKYFAKPFKLENIKYKWNQFTLKVREYFEELNKLNSGFITLAKCQITFILAVFTLNNTGLGP